MIRIFALTHNVQIRTMGVYYYFGNMTTGAANEHTIPGFGIVRWVAKLHLYDESEIIDIFQRVIGANGWSNTDVIIAIPDYDEYDSIVYEQGHISYQQTYHN